jgi:hypothetical protein
MYSDTVRAELVAVAVSVVSVTAVYLITPSVYEHFKHIINSQRFEKKKRGYGLTASRKTTRHLLFAGVQPEKWRHSQSK